MNLKAMLQADVREYPNWSCSELGVKVREVIVQETPVYYNVKSNVLVIIARPGRRRLYFPPDTAYVVQERKA